MNDEKKIGEVLTIHHENVRAAGHDPVMTVLVGSQNYGLATENSDYDTFTFVLPTVNAMASLKDPVSFESGDEYGHINVKDIRLALNLLKKTNPNSVECFASKYFVIEPDEFDTNKDMITILRKSLIHRCNTHNMMASIGGMAKQLSKRNMSPGKRLSHILRMECMVYKYFDIDSDILSLYEVEQKLAMKAKLDPDNPKWLEECDKHSDIVQRAISHADLNYFSQYEEWIDKTISRVQEFFVMRAFSKEFIGSIRRF